MKNVLAIGAHPDDIEFGCGGTIINHHLNGDKVHYLCMTSGESVDGVTGKVLRTSKEHEDEIAEARAVKLEELKHPETDEDRAKNPEWLVMLGVCTHLGCVPLDQKGDYNGWFCPCHGSHYDTSGRIRKGPAPTNMEIPKYEFVNSNTIKIG